MLQIPQEGKGEEEKAIEDEVIDVKVRLLQGDSSSDSEVDEGLSIMRESLAFGAQDPSDPNGSTGFQPTPQNGPTPMERLEKNKEFKLKTEKTVQSARRTDDVASRDVNRVHSEPAMYRRKAFYGARVTKEPEFVLPFEEKVECLNEHLKEVVLDQEIVIGDDVKKKPYGIAFKNGQESLLNYDEPSREMNLFLMGTGSSIHFGSHMYVSEAGDVLCIAALTKGVALARPTCILRGVGTLKFQSVVDFIDDFQLDTVGSASANVQGSGIQKRLVVSMEKFVVPNLIRMVLKNKIFASRHALDFPSENETIIFNIVGHSRGAVSGYALADLLDKWMVYLQTNDTTKYFQTIASKFHKQIPSEEVLMALKYLKEGKIRFEIRIVAFDPVEGAFNVGDRYSASFAVPIFGKNVHCSYLFLPRVVRKLSIFLALDERRSPFAPSIVNYDTNYTSCSVIAVLGSHGTLKGNLSKCDNQGQDSYLIQRGSPFLRLALRAQLDLCKAKLSRLINCNFQPPFERSILYNVFESPYPRTRDLLLSALRQQLPRVSALDVASMSLPVQEFVNTVLKGKDLATFIRDIESNFLKRHKESIPLCQLIMKYDQRLCQVLYFTLESDCLDHYLRPPNPSNSLLLSLLREEVREDTMWYTTTLAFPKTPATEPRYVSLRPSTSTRIIVPMNEVFAHLDYSHSSSMWYPRSPCAGNFLDDYYSDPFFFSLYDFISPMQVAKKPRGRNMLNANSLGLPCTHGTDNCEDCKASALELQQSDEVYAEIMAHRFEDLCLLFYALNVKGMLYYVNKSQSCRNAYFNLRNYFLSRLIRARFAKRVNVIVMGILLLKEKFHYQLLEDDRCIWNCYWALLNVPTSADAPLKSTTEAVPYELAPYLTVFDSYEPRFESAFGILLAEEEEMKKLKSAIEEKREESKEPKEANEAKEAKEKVDRMEVKKESGDGSPDASPRITITSAETASTSATTATNTTAATATTPTPSQENEKEPEKEEKKEDKDKEAEKEKGLEKEKADVIPTKERSKSVKRMRKEAISTKELVKEPTAAEHSPPPVVTFKDEPTAGYISISKVARPKSFMITAAQAASALAGQFQVEVQDKITSPRSNEPAQPVSLACLYAKSFAKKVLMWGYHYHLDQIGVLMSSEWTNLIPGVSKDVFRLLSLMKLELQELGPAFTSLATPAHAEPSTASTSTTTTQVEKEREFGLKSVASSRRGRSVSSNDTVVPKSPGLALNLAALPLTERSRAETRDKTPARERSPRSGGRDKTPRDLRERSPRDRSPRDRSPRGREKPVPVVLDVPDAGEKEAKEKEPSPRSGRSRSHSPSSREMLEMFKRLAGKKSHEEGDEKAKDEDEKGDDSRDDSTSPRDHSPSGRRSRNRKRRENDAAARSSTTQTEDAPSHTEVLERAAPLAEVFLTPTSAAIAIATPNALSSPANQAQSTSPSAVALPDMMNVTPPVSPLSTLERANIANISSSNPLPLSSQLSKKENSSPSLSLSSSTGRLRTPSKSKGNQTPPQSYSDSFSVFVASTSLSTSLSAKQTGELTAMQLSPLTLSQRRRSESGSLLLHHQSNSNLNLELLALRNSALANQQNCDGSHSGSFVPPIAVNSVDEMPSANLVDLPEGTLSKSSFRSSSTPRRRFKSEASALSSPPVEVVIPTNVLGDSQGSAHDTSPRPCSSPIHRATSLTACSPYQPEPTSPLSPFSSPLSSPHSSHASMSAAIAGSDSAPLSPTALYRRSARSGKTASLADSSGLDSLRIKFTSSSNLKAKGVVEKLKASTAAAEDGDVGRSTSDAPVSEAPVVTPKTTDEYSIDSVSSRDPATVPQVASSGSASSAAVPVLAVQKSKTRRIAKSAAQDDGAKDAKETPQSRPLQNSSPLPSTQPSLLKLKDGKRPHHANSEPMPVTSVTKAEKTEKNHELYSYFVLQVKFQAVETIYFPRARHVLLSSLAEEVTTWVDRYDRFEKTAKKHAPTFGERVKRFQQQIRSFTVSSYSAPTNELSLAEVLAEGSKVTANSDSALSSRSKKDVKRDKKIIEKNEKIEKKNAKLAGSKTQRSESGQEQDDTDTEDTTDADQNWDRISPSVPRKASKAALSGSNIKGKNGSSSGLLSRTTSNSSNTVVSQQTDPTLVVQQVALLVLLSEELSELVNETIYSISSDDNKFKQELKAVKALHARRERESISHLHFEQIHLRKKSAHMARVNTVANLSGSSGQPTKLHTADSSPSLETPTSANGKEVLGVARVRGTSGGDEKKDSLTARSASTPSGLPQKSLSSDSQASRRESPTSFKSLSLIDMERITEFYVQAQAFKECTSMFRAVFEKNPVMLKVLLDQISKKRNTTHYYEYTSEAGPPCINGNTALHSIILSGERPLWEVVLGYSKQPEVHFNFLKENSQGETPYDLAVALGLESIAREMGPIYTRLEPTKYYSSMNDILVKKAILNKRAL